ncbi:MAG: sterol carrier protein [Candidatus Thorarchaeota archaeon]|nr:sterol carrier protein [Candidatus Thorarchaeota archaeon]
MGDKKFVFPTEEWIEKYVEVLNASKEYEDAAHDWEGDFVFEIEADGEIIKDSIRFYLDLWHGKCRSARMAGPDDIAEFTYSGPYKNWKLLFDKKIDPIKGLMQRKFKLGKGNDMGKIMRYTKAAMELVNATTKVPTKFLDE